PPSYTHFPYTTLFRSPPGEALSDLRPGDLRALPEDPGRLRGRRGRDTGDVHARAAASRAGSAGRHRSEERRAGVDLPHRHQLLRSEEHTSELQSPYDL